MAQESCNLDKDEAEILKPSSSSSPSPSPSSPPPSSSSPPSLFLKPCEEFPVQRPERPEALAAVAPAAAAPAAAVSPSAAVVSGIRKPHVEAQSPIRFSNRCSTCQKKVGLTGFRCRCGDLFCGRHRYSDTHDCSFDYKAAGREEIAKANPVVRAAKIIKI